MPVHLCTSHTSFQVLLKGEGEIGEGGEGDDDDMGGLEEEVDKTMHLKGQMMFMVEWNVIMFLSSPVVANLDVLQVFIRNNINE